MLALAIAITTGVIRTIVMAADGYRWNGCRPGWTVQGGVYKPYRYGPWDWYR